MPSFQDIYGHTIELGLSLDSNRVFIEMHEQDDECSVLLADDTALKVASAIIELLGINPRVELPKASEMTANEAILRVAALHGRTVRFSYAKTNTSPIENREFVPENVVGVVDGHTTFNGFDHARRAIRAFRSDRIVGDVRVV